MKKFIGLYSFIVTFSLNLQSILSANKDAESSIKCFGCFGGVPSFLPINTTDTELDAAKVETLLVQKLRKKNPEKLKAPLELCFNKKFLLRSKPTDAYNFFHDKYIRIVMSANVDYEIQRVRFSHHLDENDRNVLLLPCHCVIRDDYVDLESDIPIDLPFTIEENLEADNEMENVMVEELGEEPQSLVPAEDLPRPSTASAIDIFYGPEIPEDTDNIESSDDMTSSSSEEEEQFHYNVSPVSPSNNEIQPHVDVPTFSRASMSLPSGKSVGAESIPLSPRSLASTIDSGKTVEAPKLSRASMYLPSGKSEDKKSSSSSQKIDRTGYIDSEFYDTGPPKISRTSMSLPSGKSESKDSPPYLPKIYRPDDPDDSDSEFHDARTGGETSTFVDSTIPTFSQTSMRLSSRRWKDDENLIVSPDHVESDSNLAPVPSPPFNARIPGQSSSTHFHETNDFPQPQPILDPNEITSGVLGENFISESRTGTLDTTGTEIIPSSRLIFGNAKRVPTENICIDRRFYISKGVSGITSFFLYAKNLEDDTFNVIAHFKL